MEQQGLGLTQVVRASQLSGTLVYALLKKLIFRVGM